MKRVGRIICISIIAILIAIMVITNNASAENYSVQVSYGSNSSVVAGQNVKITITLSEATTLLNGTLSYEKDKFTFNKAEKNSQGGQWNSNPNVDGVSFLFKGQSTDASKENVSVTNITFSFTAKEEIKEEVSALFELTDFSAITISEGQYTLDQMKNNGSTCSTDVTISPKSEVPVETVPTLSESNITLKQNETKQIQVTNGVTVEWKSDNESIATVDSTGKITAVAVGTATITADAGSGNKAQVSVNVEKTEEPADPSGQNPPEQNLPEQNPPKGNVNKVPSKNVITNKGNSSSVVNEAVPETGESSVGTIALLVIITLIVASIIFRGKSKIR
ncbi:MAG: Ig-like domain-containing protein [Clostridia bacterium]|nr:Ig-like domain-containing protein [Clostridia bacterium]